MNPEIPDIPVHDVYAMIIARDALVVQLLLQLGAPVIAAAWQSATDEIDEAIANGAIPWEVLTTRTEQRPLPGFEDILDVEDGDV